MNAPIASRYIGLMKYLRTLVLLLATTSLAYADKTPAPAPAPTPAPAKDAPTVSSADVQKWLAFFDKIVDIVVADKDNCPKMGTDINGAIDANTDLLKKAAEASDKGAKLPKDAEEHMHASAQKMMSSMQKCSTDKTVQAAFMRLDFKGHPKK